MMRTPLNKKRSISFAFLLLLSFKPLNTKAQPPMYVGSNCPNTIQRPLSSAYQTNLKHILTWLSKDAATSQGYNYTSIGNNTIGKDDDVYGLYDCRGDMDKSFCQFCVSTAAEEVPQRCPNRVSAMIWYDFCIVRYSNENFFGKVITYPSWHYLGKKNISNSAEIQKADDFMKGLIQKATKETNQLFYMDGFNLNSTERRYGMVQCSRDLSNEGCRQCLEALIAQLPKCCEQKLGWSIWSESCLIKYDDHIFYLLHNQASQIDGLTTDIIPLSFHNVQTEETLNTDLPVIPLITILQSTDNFSEASKLGEGGFGPVYKTHGVAVVFKVVGRNNNVLLICISGYMAPEYAMEGLFSVKSDVFSFGVLVLEIISLENVVCRKMFGIDGSSGGKILDRK
ncbi:hypothetical protein VNO77_39265 [Canavalia gladiata]|uniref:Gnk2-homologous domain-containing protein n=1 Tax=Canavalia gladiata TaxID=3824 RepID=A0AAN9PXL6_CANGL